MPLTLKIRDTAPVTQWIGGWVGPRADVDLTEKIKTLYFFFENTSKRDKQKGYAAMQQISPKSR
jgi:hypothetical protein